MNDINYKQRELNFAIKISKLCEKYPKLQLITISIRELKANISLVESILEDDEEFSQLV